MLVTPVWCQDRVVQRPLEISWFAALCDDDAMQIGVHDPSLLSSFEHCADIVVEAEGQGFDSVLLPSGYELGIDNTVFAAAVATRTQRIRLSSPLLSSPSPKPSTSTTPLTTSPPSSTSSTTTNHHTPLSLLSPIPSRPILPVQLPLMQIPLQLLPIIALLRRILKRVPREDFVLHALGRATGFHSNGLLRVEGEIAVADCGGVVVEALAAQISEFGGGVEEGRGWVGRGVVVRGVWVGHCEGWRQR